MEKRLQKVINSILSQKDGSGTYGPGGQILTPPSAKPSTAPKAGYHHKVVRSGSTRVLIPINNLIPDFSSSSSSTSSASHSSGTLGDSNGNSKPSCQKNEDETTPS